MYKYVCKFFTSRDRQKATLGFFFSTDCSLLQPVHPGDDRAIFLSPSVRCYSVRQFCNSNGSNVIFKHFLYVTQATSFWSPDGTSLFYLLCEAETWKPWKWMNRKVILLQIAAFSLHPIWTLSSPFFMPLHSVLTTRFAVHPFANFLIILYLPPLTSSGDNLWCSSL